MSSPPMSASSKKPSKSPSGHRLSQRTPSSRSTEGQHVATAPGPTPKGSQTSQMNLPDPARDTTPRRQDSNALPAAVAGMTFTQDVPSSASLEDLRKRVEEVQLGKAKSPEMEVPRDRDIFSRPRGAENIASRRALAERASSTESAGDLPSASQSVSTDSAKTVRGEDAPTPGAILTPSYPFPRVPFKLSRGQTQMSALSHKPFTLLSPTNAPAEDTHDSSPFAGGTAESELSTPAQNRPFGPSRMPSSAENVDFPSPNLYDLVLALSSEPGLEAWWSNVIHILQDHYGAERASLAVPGDMMDLENIPWGQKATFNAFGTGDDSSFLGSSPAAPEPSFQSKGMGVSPSPRFDLTSGRSVDESHFHLPVRPTLESRHSFAGHKVPERPKGPTRATSHFPDMTSRSLSNLHANREVEEDTTSQVADIVSKDGQVVAVANSESQTPTAIVYRVSRPLESEEDPLLLRTGVASLFGRSKPVVLTREYTTHDETLANKTNSHDKGDESKLSDSQRRRNEFERNTRATKQGSAEYVLGERLKGQHRLLSTNASRPGYEEYEQPEPSPWSQSPAPSPAARPDPEESPFFTSGGKIDETAFEQNPPNYDYSQTHPLEAIGADTSKTLIHVPLVQYVSPHAKAPSPLRFPMAVLSISTPLNPYPTNLRRSLSHLLPHLAASYSLANQYTLLEARSVGISGSHYGPGFGLGGTFSDESSELELVAELSGQIAQGAISAHGSLHSPSASTASRESPAGSVAGTPSFDPAAFGFSPGVALTPGRMGSDMVDSYFTAKRNRETGSHSQTNATRPNERPVIVRPSFEESPASGRFKKGKSNTTAQNTSKTAPKSGAPRTAMSSAVAATEEKDSGEHGSRPSTGLQEEGRQMSTSTILTNKGGRDSSSRPLPDLISQLMLNSVPLQLFLAKPKTGELLWTNTRFQAFRSQEASQRIRDPWLNVHPEDIRGLEAGWKKVLKSGTQFTMHIRVKRFNNDSDYRWFIFRASTLLSQIGQILYFIGSFMDVHEQHLAELNAAEEKELSARDAKYRALANSIPQILFEAVEDQGIVSANDQWYVFSGQSMEDAVDLGFARHIHRDDLVKCGILLPAVATSDPADQEFTLSFSDSEASDASTMLTASSATSNKTVQASGHGDKLPQSTKPPSLGDLVKDGVISVQDDERGRPSYSIEIRLRSKGGEFRWFLVRLVKVDSPLLNEGRASWYGTCTDIHDRKNLERELNRAMTKLNKEMESKTRFFANMSHEIRTPLNGILGSIPWLLESEIDVEQRRTLDTIQNSSNNLRELVDNILDVTKVEAGKMNLVHRWFHVRTLLEDTIDTISSRAIDRGLELNYTVDLEVPHTVKGDAFRLRQVLINLIGNAVKFTEQGEIYAHCSIQKGKDPQPSSIMLVFDVTDTGKGFTDEDAERLFKQFGQIEGSNTQHEAGTGLGLFLSKQLVEMHGGQLTATGQEGQGATFSFSVRVGLPTAADQPTSPQAPKVKRKVSNIAEGVPASPGGTLASLMQKEDAASPGIRPLTSPNLGSPGPLSATSSVPSLRSAHYMTDRSTPSSLLPTPESTHSLQTSKFTTAMAPSERQKLAEMAMAAKPVVEGLPEARAALPGLRSPHPTTFSIVIICPAKYARNAFKQHIEQVVPHEIAANVTTLSSIDEWVELFKGPVPPVFTHVVLDIQDSVSVELFMRHIADIKTTVVPELVVITDHYQKREIMNQQKTMLDAGLKVYLVTKPVKPSVFALIFDPSQLRNLSKDRGRDLSAAKTEDFKNVTTRVTDMVGDKGFRILVVEDSDVNRMVILKYLHRVKLETEFATNGLECTQKVLSKGLDYYSLIICDIQMPIKNGYEVCEELRAWERKNGREPMPIMALSANAMPEEKATAANAGFTDYLTKPVDFNTLGQMIMTLLDPKIPHIFLRDRPDRLGL